MGEQTSEPKDRQHSFSRRGFLGLAGTGLVSFLGVTLDNNTIRYAYADETGQITWEVRVVARWEVGIVVCDPTKSDPGNGRISPVPHAKVTFTSHANNKQFLGTADAEGTLVIDLREYAETDPYGWDQFACWGSLLIEKEGYRVYETGMARLRGADVVVAPTQLTDNKPYFRKITFNDFDIQYTKDMAFTSLNSNRETHTVSIKFATPSNEKVTLGYWHKGTKWQEQTVTPQGGIAEVSLSHADLLYDYALNTWGFTIGKPTEVRASQGKVSIKAPTTLEIVEGCINDALGGKDQSFPFYSSSSSSTPQAVKITVPKGVPVIGESVVSIWTPELPFAYSFDPFGYAAVGLGIDTTIYQRKDGRYDPKGSKYQPRKSVADQWKKLSNDRAEMQKKYRDARSVAGPFTSNGVIGMSSKFRWGWSAGAAFFAKWAVGERKWAGGAEMSIGMSLFYKFSIQYSLGPVPTYLSFDFGADAKATITGLMKVGGFFETFDWKSQGGELDALIAVGVGVGVGLDGIASVGVRGGGFITGLVGYSPTNGKPQPHLAVQGGMSLSWVVQVFIAKWSGVIVQEKWPKIYDNWATGLAAEAASENANNEQAFRFLLDDGTIGFSCGSSGTPGGTVSNPSNGFCLVKNSELAETKELVGTSIAPITQSAPEVLAISEEGLSAQVDDAAVLAVDAADAMLGEFTYTDFLDDGGATTLEQCVLASVDAVGAYGVKPSSDVLIYRDVFSAPQVKVVTARGSSYLFRVLTVEYPGNQLRSRVSVSLYQNGAWQAPKVIEYAFFFEDHSIADKRKDAFDYDFDVAVNKSANAAEFPLCVNVISGTRSEGDNTKLAGLFKSSWYASQLQLKPDGTVARATTVRVNIPQNTNIIPLHPFVEWIDSDAVLYGYLKARIPDGLTPFEGTSSAEIDFTYRNPDHSKRKPDWTSPIESEFGEAVSEWERPVLFQTSDQSTSERLIEFLIPLTARKTGGVYYTYEGRSGKNTPVFSREGTSFRRTFIDGREGILFLETSDESDLLWFKPCDEPVGRAVGPQNFKIKSFIASEDGKWLYMTRGETGPAADIVDPETGKHTSQPDKKLHQIFASKYRGEGYGEPFPFCELAYPADDLRFTNLGINHEAASVLYTSITDMTRSAANIRCATVPYLKFIELTSFYSSLPLVGAGKDESFFVECRNDGNTLVSGFKMDILDEADRVIQTIPVDCTRENVVADQEDAFYGAEGLPGDIPEEERGIAVLAEAPLDAAAEAGVLVPGRHRLYKTMLHIPEDWRGKKVLKARVQAGSIAIAVRTGANQFGEDEKTASAALDGTMMLSLSLHEAEVNAAELGLSDAAQACSYTFEQSGEESVKKPLVATGDENHFAIPTACAVVGAGLLAYSARRSKLEGVSEGSAEGDSPQ